MSESISDKDVSPLRGLVEKALFDLKKSEKSPKNKVADAWNQLVGPRIGKHTRPYALRGKRLFVRVDDSSWAFELSTRYKATLLRRLKHAVGEDCVSDIFFKVGDL